MARGQLEEFPETRCQSSISMKAIGCLGSSNSALKKEANYLGIVFACNRWLGSVATYCGEGLLKIGWWGEVVTPLHGRSPALWLPPPQIYGKFS